MADRVTAEQRSRNMAAVRSRDTRPEMVVRRYLWGHGFRYRLSHPRLPGKPDIVMRKYRTCIFVNGCFWHGHEGCRYFVVPKTRTEFWQAKIRRNRERDKEVRRKLASMGWYCIVLWECQLRGDRREETLRALVVALSRIFLKEHAVKRYAFPDAPDRPMVADSPTDYKPKQ